MTKAATRVLRYINHAAIAVCAVCIVVMMGYGFVDVLGRYLFDRPLYGTYELSELLLATIVFLSLAACQAEDRHMRVDFLFSYIGDTGRKIIDAVAYSCSIAICIMVIYYSIDPAIYSWTIKERTFGIISFPVYPVKAIVVVGFVLLALQLVLDLIKTLVPSEDGAGTSPEQERLPR